MQIRHRIRKDHIRAYWLDSCDLDWIDSVYERTEPFLDRDFLIRLDNAPLASHWEMYLCHKLLVDGWNLVPTKDRPTAHGPDFLAVGHDNQRIWIEATTASAGTGKDKVPEPESVPDVRFLEDESIMLRYRSSIFEKHAKVQSYLDGGIVGRNDIVIIAIDGSSLLDASDDDPPHRIAKCVYPVGDEAWSVDRSGGAARYEGFQRREKITKLSGAGVQTDIFLEKEYCTISAVLSSTIKPLTGRRPRRGELVLVHNSFSKNPAPRGLLLNTTEYWWENNKLLSRLTPPA
jgi:hypothetical protein